MLDKVFTNNQVTIAGRVVGEFGYSHTVYGEEFYTGDSEVSRLSNSNPCRLPGVCAACQWPVPFL